MNIAELKTGCPRLYAEAFAAGVNDERKRILTAELIVGSAKSQPQINAPLAAVERLQESKKWDARAMMLRSEIAQHLSAL
jgi:hypothetical protein